MKSKDIATNYGVDPSDFRSWMKQTHLDFKDGIFDYTVADSDIVQYISYYRSHLKRIQEKVQQECIEADQRRQQQRIEAERKQAALANMLITSGFTFDGYRIIKYSGYISGDDAIQVPRGTSGFFTEATDVGASLMASLVKIRRNALNELKEAAYDLGCNAVIGVDFDYLTLDPETANSHGGTTYLPYVFGVTANGNTVVIEKIENK